MTVQFILIRSPDVIEWYQFLDWNRTNNNSLPLLCSRYKRVLFSAIKKTVTKTCSRFEGPNSQSRRTRERWRTTIAPSTKPSHDCKPRNGRKNSRNSPSNTTSRLCTFSTTMREWSCQWYSQKCVMGDSKMFRSFLHFFSFSSFPFFLSLSRGRRGGGARRWRGLDARAFFSFLEFKMYRYPLFVNIPKSKHKHFPNGGSPFLMYGSQMPCFIFSFFTGHF